MQVTNDAWFGEASGPYQHFAQARVRAIEQGLPLARAANTGISAMVDPFGRVVASLGLGEAGYIDAVLPAPLPPTAVRPFRRCTGFDCDRRSFWINCFKFLSGSFPKVAPIT